MKQRATVVVSARIAGYSYIHAAARNAQCDFALSSFSAASAGNGREK